MGLDPLEFADCLTDSPAFRAKLMDHEKELETTSKAIKNLIADGKELLHASKNLAKAQKTFSQTLMDFNFVCIGDEQTDDEILISGALKEFSQLMNRIEDERERMLEKANDQFLKPLETFRKQQIGQVKEGKKQFEKQTQKYCNSLERYLSQKTKVPENVFKEADAQLDLERRGFYQHSMNYVLKLQEVQERKKFEFVEIVLVFMYSLLTFYHEGHETAADNKPYLSSLQHTLQKTRSNFETTRDQAQKLMMKMLESRGAKSIDQSGTVRSSQWTRQGYLYQMEKKALANSWIKYWCSYCKNDRRFFMLQYSQSTGKMIANGETLKLKTCIRRASDTIDRRFCMDVTFEEKQGVFTFQALSDEDRKLWMDAMDGKEPIYNKPQGNAEDSLLNDIGFSFIKKCIHAIESRGLDDQGLYRVVGVNSKVSKLISLGLDSKKADKLDLNDPQQYEVKTITSAVKNYLRSLKEPLMTFGLHPDFIVAAKRNSPTLRLHDIHTLVHKLPPSNFEMLDIIVNHLRRVSRNSEKNLMTVANLGVCFGPTLMRPEEESVAAIMDIKFCNIVIEILVNNYEMIFQQAPEDPELRTNLAKNNPIKRPKSTAPPPPTNVKPQVTATAMSVAALSSNNQSPRQFTTQSPVQPYNQQQQPTRGKLRPVDVYNPTTGSFETQTNHSISGSSESLNSNQSNHTNNLGTPGSHDPHRRMVVGRSQVAGPMYSNINVSELANRLILSTSDVPTFGSIKKRSSTDHSTNSMSTSMHGPPTQGRIPPSMTGSVSGSLGSVSTNSSVNKRRTVRTLYHCEAENPTELSFEPNQIIKNVCHSKEPGWLEGTLGDRTGLIPENYVEYID